MVFKKGQSGNPKGAGLEVNHKRRVAAELLSHLVPRAVKIYEEMLGEDDNKAFAAKDILDRCFGKPHQAVELSGKDGGPLIAVIKDRDKSNG